MLCRKCTIMGSLGSSLHEAMLGMMQGKTNSLNYCSWSLDFQELIVTYSHVSKGSCLESQMGYNYTIHKGMLSRTVAGNHHVKVCSQTMNVFNYTY